MIQNNTLAELGEHARSLLQRMLQPGSVLELRAFVPGNSKDTTVSGYFDDIDKLVAAAASLDNRAHGIYVTLNPVDPALLARANNRLVHSPKSTTSDHDIPRRLRLLIDADPVRPSGISSNDTEHAAAITTVNEISAFLAAQGFPTPLVGDSGNGAHLIYAIDLPRDDGGLVQSVLKALAFGFDTAAVKVDQSVHNPARITKLYGTFVRKGDNTADRPHRRSKILSSPAELAVVPEALLRKIAAMAPSEPPRPSPQMRAGAHDMDIGRMLAARGIEVARSGAWQNGERWVLSTCPFNAEHTDSAAYVVRFANGAVAAGCHHNGCQGKSWKELLPILDPERLWQATKSQPDSRMSRKPPPRPASIAEYRPFPLDTLPEPMRSFVTAAGAAIVCDPVFIALPLLAALASVIGTTRRIRLKRGWEEFPILWTAVVARSGTVKSPAFERAMRTIRLWEWKKTKEHEKAMHAYIEASNQYASELTEWKKNGRTEGASQPKRPEKPARHHLYTEDTTVEALCGVIDEQPRGTLMARDEMSGWFGSFDAYRQGKGGDVAHWLNMHGGRSVKVNRKTGEKTCLFIPMAAVCVAGGIQPRVLQKSLTGEHFANGLAARLLVAMPPTKAKKWSESEIPYKVEKDLESVFEKLLKLEFKPSDDGESRPVDLGLTEDAKDLWIKFVNAHGIEQLELDEDLAAAWSKLEGYASRLALIFHLIRQAAGDPSLESPEYVDVHSMRAGIKLARWFGNEARRVYAVLRESDEDRAQRDALDRIRNLGGEVSVRRWQQLRSHATSDDAEHELQQFVDAELGTWDHPKPDATGGRPTKVFLLRAKSKTPDSDPPQGDLSVSEPDASREHSSISETEPTTPFDNTSSGRPGDGVSSEVVKAPSDDVDDQTDCLRPIHTSDPADVSDTDETPNPSVQPGVMHSENPESADSADDEDGDWEVLR
jgi:hypothetical protein